MSQGSYVLVKGITVNIRLLPTMFEEGADNVCLHLAGMHHMQQTCSLLVEVGRKNTYTVSRMLPSLQIVLSARFITNFTLQCAPQVILHSILCSCIPSINADIH